MLQDWMASLKERSGRSVDEWMDFIAKKGPKTEPERREWLKKECGLGTNNAWWLAERSVGKGGDEDSPEAYLAHAKQYLVDMYAGKESLKPIHEAVLEAAGALGKDVKACPCKTIVPLYRNHVFAQIKPSTKTRVDLGFALGASMKEGKTKFPARLIDTGGFKKKDRITHRIELTKVEDIDAELLKWLKKAYELDE
jgi:hypothetical protein